MHDASQVGFVELYVALVVKAGGHAQIVIRIEDFAIED
jgi:hypothetical protein